MLKRRTMDQTHQWGANKGADREYAKALRDHSGSGSTSQLVEVEIGVEVTGDKLEIGQAGDLESLVLDGPIDSVAAIYNYARAMGYL